MCGKSITIIIQDKNMLSTSLLLELQQAMNKGNGPGCTKTDDEKKH